MLRLLYAVRCAPVAGPLPHYLKLDAYMYIYVVFHLVSSVTSTLSPGGYADWTVERCSRGASPCGSHRVLELDRDDYDSCVPYRPHKILRQTGG